jgi:SAM-dependent methyltransferase
MSATTDVIREFWVGRTAIDGHVASRFHGEHDAYDLPAIAALAGADARVLDLGCGTCSVSNALADLLGWSIHAVDFMPDFLRHAEPRVTTEVGDVRTYRSDERFDLVLLLGVITYVESAADRADLYERCAQMLSSDGAPLLIKAQFGVEREVVVDTDSEALGARYRGIYPSLADEVALLSERFDVEVRDPYPAALSPHADTHFHHLVARRRP